MCKTLQGRTRIKAPDMKRPFSNGEKRPFGCDNYVTAAVAAGPFIQVWESLAGIISVPLPGDFACEGLKLNLIH